MKDVIINKKLGLPIFIFLIWLGAIVYSFSMEWHIGGDILGTSMLLFMSSVSGILCAVVAIYYRRIKKEMTRGNSFYLFSILLNLAVATLAILFSLISRSMPELNFYTVGFLLNLILGVILML